MKHGRKKKTKNTQFAYLFVYSNYTMGARTQLHAHAYIHAHTHIHVYIRRCMLYKRVVNQPTNEKKNSFVHTHINQAAIFNSNNSNT